MTLAKSSSSSEAMTTGNQYYLSPNNVVKKSSDDNLRTLSLPPMPSSSLAASYSELTRRWKKPPVSGSRSSSHTTIKRSKSCDTDRIVRTINLKLEIKPSDIRQLNCGDGKKMKSVLSRDRSPKVSVEALDLAKSKALQTREKERKKVSFAI